MPEKIEKFTGENLTNPDSPLKVVVKRNGGKIAEITCYNQKGDVEYFINQQKIDEIKKKIRKMQEKSKSKDIGLEEKIELSLAKDIPDKTRDRILELIKAQGFMESEKNPKNLRFDQVKKEYEEIKKEWQLLCTNYISLGNDLYYEEEIWINDTADNAEPSSEQYRRFLKDDKDNLIGTSNTFAENDEKVYKKFELFNMFNKESDHYENMELTIKNFRNPEIVSIAKIDPATNDYSEYIDEEKLNKMSEKYILGTDSVKAERIFEALKDLTLKKLYSKLNES